MLPTQEQLDRRIADAGQSPVPQAGPIAVSDLKPVEPLPFAQPQPSILPDISALGADFSITPEEKQAETTVRDLNAETRSLIQSLSGRSAFQAEQEKQQGISGLRQEQNQLANRLKSLQNEALAIPLQLQQEAIGKGMTAGGLQPIQTAALRNNAIQALSTASLLEASRGNLTTALDLVDRAVSTKYDPIKSQIDANLQSLQLVMESPDFTNAQKKRAEERLRAEQDRRIAIEKALEEEKYNKRGITDTLNTLASYGASSDVLKRVSEARTYDEAIRAAGPLLQNPVVKQELINAQMDAALKKARLRRENYEFSLLQKYGGMTPKQYADYVAGQNKLVSEAKGTAAKSQAQAQILNEKVDLTKAILNSKAVGSVVGTVPGLSRSPKTVLGNIAGLVTPFTTKTTIKGLYNKVTGEQQALIASTEQLVSKEFLDNLINVKAQGATFGALTEKEQDALTNAATLIGGRRVYSGTGEEKQVVGYNMSEKAFKAEVQRIHDLARTAYERSSGETWTSEEQRVWDTLQQVEDTYKFDPAF